MCGPFCEQIFQKLFQILPPCNLFEIYCKHIYKISSMAPNLYPKKVISYNL